MRIRKFLKSLHCIISWVGPRKYPFSIFTQLNHVWVFLCVLHATRLSQWFSSFVMNQSHPEVFLSVVSDAGGLGSAWECAFLTSPQEMPILFAWVGGTLHFENHLALGSLVSWWGEWREEAQLLVFTKDRDAVEHSTDDRDRKWATQLSNSETCRGPSLPNHKIKSRWLQYRD